MVATGLGKTSRNSEILDGTLSSAECENFANFDNDISYATGSLVNMKGIICGGFIKGVGFSKDCLGLTKTSTHIVAEMKIKRSNAASVTAHPHRLWVLGGVVDEWSYGFDSLYSTEYIKFGEESKMGPDLPFPLYQHAIFAINAKIFMMVGGDTINEFYLSTTFKFSDNKWTIGPYLKQGRSGHAARIIKDRVTKENFMVVTGGFNGTILDSVEILYTETNQWVEGKQYKTWCICYLC